MSQSLAQIVLHLIFSTKERQPFITNEIKPNLHAYLATIARDELGCVCYRVGGVEDHVHLAIGFPRTKTVAEIVQNLKTTSSHWMKRSQNCEKFAWQGGYGVFSVSPKDLHSLIGYIDRQEEHHKTTSFQDEYRTFLKKYGVDYDETYVWG